MTTEYQGGWPQGGPNPAVAPGPAPQAAPAAPTAPAGDDWITEAAEAPVAAFWTPARWEGLPHVFLGCRDLGEVERFDPPELKPTCAVETIIVFSGAEWGAYYRQEVRQAALYNRLVRAKRGNAIGYIVLGEKKKGRHAPWILREPDDALVNYVRGWAQENTERDVDGSVVVTGTPTLDLAVPEDENPPADDSGAF